MHQWLLDGSLDFDLFRAWGLRLGIESSVETFRQKPFANPFHTPAAGAQGEDDLVIPIRQLVGRIGQQKNTSMGQFARGRFADRNQFFHMRTVRLVSKSHDTFPWQDSFPWGNQHYDNPMKQNPALPVNRRLIQH